MVCAVRGLPVDIQCQSCSRWYNILVNPQDMQDWLSGSLAIEKALDYLSPSEREILLSQICGECFDAMFLPLDNDE